MNTKFYEGKFIPGVGIPYVIFCGVDVGQVGFKLYKFVIFYGFDGSIDHKSQIVNHPRIWHENLDDFLKAEQYFAKEDLFFMVTEKYADRLKQVGFMPVIDLEETNAVILLVLAEKAGKLLKFIQEKAPCENLKQLIGQALALKVNRNDIR